MKIKRRRTVIHICTLALLSFANVISYSGSLLLNGEPDVPKSLIR